MQPHENESGIKKPFWEIELKTSCAIIFSMVQDIKQNFLLEV